MFYIYTNASEYGGMTTRLQAMQRSAWSEGQLTQRKRLLLIAYQSR